MQTDGSGAFAFADLPAGEYRVSVSGAGMSTFLSPPIHLRAGGAQLVPNVVLSVQQTTTSVTVNGDKEQLSVEQVQIAEQQRMLGGALPDYYTSFNWNAPPMLAKQKYHLLARQLTDPISFLVVAGIAGAEQYKGVFPAYGSGFEGYGKRYGAAMANRVAGQLLGRAVYSSLFREDPRYFYKGTGSVSSRTVYALSRSVIARKDDGRWGPAYAAILGDFSASALSNLYYPSSDRGASLVFFNGLADIGADAAGNLFREFVFKKITSKFSDRSPGH